jgi:hypothetical protein
MSARAGFTVSRLEGAASRPSPNGTQAKITVEIRCHWPSRAGHADAVRAALTSAYAEAMAQVEDFDA